MTKIRTLKIWQNLKMKTRTRRPLSSSNQVALIDSQADFQQLDSGNWRLRDPHNMKMEFGCHLFFQQLLEDSI